MDTSQPSFPISWSIPIEAEKYLTSQIERNLNFFNRLGKGNFYFADYYRQIIFSSSSSTTLLTVHSKHYIESSDMRLYHENMIPKERKWLEKLNEEILRIFYTYDAPDRLDLEFAFELTARDINQKEIVLHHKVTPFELDLNGNLWLALIFVSKSPSHCRSEEATITNFKTGDKYEYNGTKFVESKYKILTDEEIAILHCLAKGMIEKQISDLLRIPKSSLGRKKHSAFCKLNAKTAPEAIFLAKERNII